MAPIIGKTVAPVVALPEVQQPRRLAMPLPKALATHVIVAAYPHEKSAPGSSRLCVMSGKRIDSKFSRRVYTSFPVELSLTSLIFYLSSRDLAEKSPEIERESLDSVVGSTATGLGAGEVIKNAESATENRCEVLTLRILVSDSDTKKQPRQSSSGVPFLVSLAVPNVTGGSTLNDR